MVASDQRQRLEPQRTRRDAEGSTRDEPDEEAAFEFLGGGADSATVVGVGNFPELGVGISGADNLRVTQGNVAVDLAVNQENRDCRGCDGIFRGNILHAEVILQAGAEKGNFDEWAEDGASDPRAEVERLSHAVVGDLAKIGEGRFGDYGAEVWVSVEGLEELRGAHGFAEGEDAAGMRLGL